jgi:hypothetical protein
MARIKKPVAAKTVRTNVRARTKAVKPVALNLKPSEDVLTKPQVISMLSKSPHGDLSGYVPVGLRSAQEDPDFFAHLLAWDARNGQVRDAKVALPVIAWASRSKDADYTENALAHLASLDPRNFVRALDFAKQMKVPSRMTRRLVKRYLANLEADSHAWERAAVQHRGSLKELYARFSVKPTGFADDALFKEIGSGKLSIVRQLPLMTPLEAAGAIAKYRIPFLIARGALGAKIKNQDLLLALVNAMTPTEVVTNAVNLQKLGVLSHASTRAAFEEAMKKAAESKNPRATLKTSKAAAALSDAGENVLADKMRNVQEKQLDKLKGIEGNWLVLADKSGSMTNCIEYARQITAILTRLVKGKVHLVFFDNSPRYYDATGQTLEELTKLTKGITAVGGTDISCGIKYAIEKGLHVDGIAIISDGQDNFTGRVTAEYKKYAAKMGSEPTVYFYKVEGSSYDALTRELTAADLKDGLFDLTANKVDFYSLPNLVQTMRVGRYSLLDEVLDTPLKTLDKVLTKTVGYGVVNNGSPNTVTA